MGFADHFRVRLTKTLPIPLAPRPRSDAVHVMTCHASKGLEFPCVVVVGQTIPGIQENYDWIPPSQRPSESREEEQANSLLFVGVTRAKRAVVVSFPQKATATSKGRGKKIVPLLGRWRAVFGVPSHEWSAAATPELRANAVNIWGAPLPMEIKASKLNDSVCPLLTYLEEFLDARFPEAPRALYPAFFSAVRSSIRLIAVRAIESGLPLSERAARDVLESQWPWARYSAHPHAALYRDAAVRMVIGFARAFRPEPGGGADLDPEIRVSAPGMPDLRLDLIAHFRQADGKEVAIAFRPESLPAKKGSLNWSALAPNKRISLVLLENDSPGIAPRVYSGDDGQIYDYRWSRDETSLPTQAAELLGQRDAFARGDFSTDLERFQCDQCRVRASCPHWLGSLPKT